MIVTLYTAGLGVLFVGLSSRVIYFRRTLQVPHGNPKLDPRLEKSIRTQENFLNYVPLGMLILWMCEKEEAMSPKVLHLTAGLLTIGRIIHVAATSQIRENYLWRPVSMTFTLTAILAACLALLRKGIQ
jgi:uncharacterized membrane protein YecN with MAPEG domain